MTWLLIIVGAVILAAVALPVIGAIYPPRPMAKQILKTRLRELGIDGSNFSDDCLNELADHSIRLAKWLASLERSGSWRKLLEEHAQSTAWEVHAIVMGSGDYAAEKLAAAAAKDAANPVWGILAKHDPKRFSLAGLEMTQSTNQMLRETAASMR